MDKIIKAVTFGGKARVSVMDITETVNKAIAVHGLSPLTSATLGRSLMIGAYISANLKGAREKFNVIIDGKGPIGKIYVAGDAGGKIKGYVENPVLDLPAKNGKLDVGGAVGIDGDMLIIKDLGLKEPYIGRCELVSGEIAEDYATYLFKSEGIPSAVAFGVLTDKDGCKAAGGIVVEALPDADDNMIFILEDIMTNFNQISTLLTEETAEEIMDFYFGHLDTEIFPAEPIEWYCNCKEKVKMAIRSLGIEEAKDIIKEQGEIEVKCDYCNTKYHFNNDDLDEIFN